MGFDLVGYPMPLEVLSVFDFWKDGSSVFLPPGYGVLSFVGSLFDPTLSPPWALMPNLKTHHGLCLLYKPMARKDPDLVLEYQLEPASSSASLKGNQPTCPKLLPPLASSASSPPANPASIILVSGPRPLITHNRN